MFTLLAFLAVAPAVLVSAQIPRAKAILGCTTNSFEAPSWFIDSFHYASTANSSTSGSVSFHLLNRANNYTADLACQAGKSGEWASCSIKNGWNKTVDGSLQASVQLNASTANFLLNQTWTCNDRNNSRP